MEMVEEWADETTAGCRIWCSFATRYDLHASEAQVA